MRQRVEDLGRLAVMIDHLLELDVFEKYETIRPKRIQEHYDSLSDEKKQQLLSDYAYGLEEIKSTLYSLRDIAFGHDYINAPID